MNRSIRSKLSLILGIALFLPLAAHSYGYKTFNGNKRTWNTDRPRLRASGNSFPSGNAFRTALNDAIGGINDNPSNFSINLTHGENKVGKGNLQNEVWFSSDNNLLDGAPAVAFSKYAFKRIVSVDVVVDNQRSWTTSTSKTAMREYGGSGRPFRNVIYHEVGHLFGLGHENDEYNVMGEDWSHIITNGNDTTSYFGEDAADGAMFLYGKDSGEDVSVSHWRWTGRDGEYSTHGRTRVFDTGGNRLNRDWIDSEPHYKVDNGQTIEVEFSYENNGANLQNGVQAGFYLSTNHLITTRDQRLRGGSFDLGVNNVYETTVTINLPNNLDPNTNYWIGVIIDENDSLSEFDENNNATYVGLRTKNFTPPTATPTPTNTPRPTSTPTPTPVPTTTPVPTFDPEPIVPTPTPPGIIPTPGPTLLPTIPGVPTLFPTLPPIPTQFPPLPDDFIIELPPRVIEFDSPAYEQISVPLTKASTLVGLDPDDPLSGTPEFLMGGLGDLSSMISVTLPSGSILASALQTQDALPVLTLIKPDGDMSRFGTINLESITIENMDFAVENASIVNMLFDGKKVVLFMRAAGRAQDESARVFDLMVKTEIYGPFTSASVDEMSLHE